MKRIVAAEQFYTSAGVADKCVALVKNHYNLNDFDLVLEPAAGAGAFLLKLPMENRIGLDIFPNHPEVKQLDFFQWRPAPEYRRILTIGNPPFGRRAKLAVQFINRAAEFSDVIAFILPRSFNKYTFQNRIPEQFHLIDSLDLEDFEDTGGAPVSVRAVFQIWEKREDARQQQYLARSHADFELRHAHLSRVSPEELAFLHRNYDFVIAQVGKDFRPKNPEDITKGSHWFVKANIPEVRATFETLDFSFLDGKNTALKSISKADIVTAYIRALR